jgi:DNA-binding SARP family transcriptional activator
MFIPGAFEFDWWLSRKRARLRAQASRAAWELVDEMESVQAQTHAAFWARRAVELAPDDEQGVRRLIALLDRVGDCAGALRVYEEFSRRLASEYEIAPSSETMALVHGIRTRVQYKGSTMTSVIVGSVPNCPA